MCDFLGNALSSQSDCASEADDNKARLKNGRGSRKQWREGRSQIEGVSKDFVLTRKQVRLGRSFIHPLGNSRKEGCVWNFLAALTHKGNHTHEPTSHRVVRHFQIGYLKEKKGTKWQTLDVFATHWQKLGRGVWQLGVSVLAEGQHFTWPTKSKITKVNFMFLAKMKTKMSMDWNNGWTD